MELKQFIKLIFEKKKMLLSWWLGIIVVGFLIAAIVPDKKIATLSIDIGRDRQEQESGEYQFDQFYRLEADDRFANTIVQWSKDPNVQRVISDGAKDDLGEEKISLAIKSLRAEKKSANLVQITFEVQQQKDAAPFAKSLHDIFVQKTNSLNSGNTSEGWFKIIGSGPTVNEQSFSPFLLLVLLATGGLLITIFIVLLSHYLKEEEKPNEDRV